MHKSIFLTLIASLTIAFEGTIHADTDATGSLPETETSETQAQAPKAPFVPFTGKITKNKVRMRLQPNLESNILRELNANDLLLILGEKEDFYATQAPEDMKAYIYRTFVLDGVVEGNHVNVRLEPDLTSPIIAQLNSGDPVNGTILQADKKWMEIAPPTSTRFYVAKEYVIRAGDANYLSALQKQKKAAEEQKAELAAKEAQKPEIESAPKADIAAEPVKEPVKEIATEPAKIQVETALALAPPPTPATPPQPSIDPSAKVTPWSGSPYGAPITIPPRSTGPTGGAPLTVNDKMSAWLDVEEQLFETWVAQNDNAATMQDFYDEQSQHSVTLQGLVEPYQRTVKNKPGDYVLLSPSSHLPIAYLYSTQVNLQEKAGQEAVIQALPRDNHHFAYPAYYVISAN